MKRFEVNEVSDVEKKKIYEAFITTLDNIGKSKFHEMIKILGPDVTAETLMKSLANNEAIQPQEYMLGIIYNACLWAHELITNKNLN